jgi:hypothetical protein
MGLGAAPRLGPAARLAAAVPLAGGCQHCVQPVAEPSTLLTEACSVAYGLASNAARHFFMIIFVTKKFLVARMPCLAPGVRGCCKYTVSMGMPARHATVPVTYVGLDVASGKACSGFGFQLLNSWETRS